MSDSRPDPTPMSEKQVEVFLSLLSQHERRLSMYVSGLVTSSHDVEDILQLGKIVMWRNFHKFEIGTNFLAWGRKIMLRQILDYRKRTKRQKQQLYFDEDILELLDHEMTQSPPARSYTERELALEKCLRRLPDFQREVVNLRYQQELSIGQISHRLSKTDTAIYQLLYRIRKTLHDCVTQRLNPSP